MTRHAAACAGLAIAAFVAGCSGGDQPSGPGNPDGGQRSALTLDETTDIDLKQLYLGVSCVGRGNFVGCDRVCIYALVRKAHPDHLVARFAGHSTRMAGFGSNSYEGCLRRDGLLHRGPLAVRADATDHWFGVPAVRVPVRIQAVFPGRSSYLELPARNTRLGAGYG